jgi:hypothetical protein
MNMKKTGKRLSTWFAIAIWGFSVFMAQPTIASFATAVVLLPPLLFLTVVCAFHEGKDVGIKSAIADNIKKQKEVKRESDINKPNPTI